AHSALTPHQSEQILTPSQIVKISNLNGLSIQNSHLRSFEAVNTPTLPSKHLILPNHHAADRGAYQLHPLRISARAASIPVKSKVAVTGLSLYGVTLATKLVSPCICFSVGTGEPGKKADLWSVETDQVEVAAGDLPTR